MDTAWPPLREAVPVRIAEPAARLKVRSDTQLQRSATWTLSSRPCLEQCVKGGESATLQALRRAVSTLPFPDRPGNEGVQCSSAVTGTAGCSRGFGVLTLRHI